MKPNFALVLSFDGIRLLHRAPAGWLRVGAAALDAPDLTAELEGVRGKALRLDPGGIRAKLVIPNEQIRYLTIETGDLDEGDIPARVRDALDGATPYAVGDLAFDWARDGAQTHIAAVARETLDEAEDFATEHAFNPVSFVAIPPEGAFSGEPFFGPAPSSAGWLPATESLTRDLQPIRVVGRAEVPAAPPPTAPEQDEPAESAPVAEAEADVQEGAPDTPEAASQAADDAPEAAPSDADTPETVPEPDDTPETDETGEEEAPPLAVPVETPPVPAFSSIRAARDEVPPPPRVSATAPVIELEDDLPGAPPVTGKPAAAKPARDVHFTGPARPDGDAGQDSGGFFSRRGGSEARKAPAPPRPAPIPPAPPDLSASLLATAPAAADPETERQRMTIFGARQPARPRAQVGGKPRYLGLILTVALLLFLAGVAAWASIFSDEGLSRLWGPVETEVVTLPDEGTAPIDTLEIEGDEALSGEDEIDLAAVDPTALPDTLLPEDTPETLAQPAPLPDLTPEEAAVRYAATGIWQMAPEPPETPGFTQLDELYTASIDPKVDTGDAVALPPVSALLGDAMMEPQASPAAPGTAFDLDERGLVRATPEGALTPDGIPVYAGRPPLLPARLPTRFEQTPQEITEDLARLAAFRPRTRPGDLVQQNERSNLGGLTRDELAEIRPRLRPEAAKAEEEVDETATAQAVGASLKPRVRPSNIAQIVQRAESIERTQPVQTAAVVAPRTVSPSVPSSASVAREATVQNAIRLNRVNLIGVYGKPSSRRALVRMSNGRYVKVQVGDRLDGGRVQAIGESELSYVKNGRAVTLTMPRG
ncbi:type IV pilus biogenesis protein PilP [Lutimaribacter pacificus]|uniref:Type IV pilus biogenesis protein PilP n=1 Tax=Lutimaribacter pacificus TaxID=391948 RepID=A0A1H0JHA7_9RHOB|nr:hypothetical protein [Lutimaribacter pacificus]SDO42819.1 type IV pilus biogenesis protein PilP [Lutimaribacter pacificus]SHK10414.1 type IV pilus biogenesis protein PilP [Lutimaribacter pacificus]